MMGRSRRSQLRFDRLSLVCFAVIGIFSIGVLCLDQEWLEMGMLHRIMSGLLAAIAFIYFGAVAESMRPRYRHIYSQENADV